MIKFHCKNCGHKFRVPEIHAGKKGKCPKCKSVVVVPQIKDISSVSVQAGPNFPEVKPKAFSPDPRLFDISQENKAANQPSSQQLVSDTTSEDLQQLQESFRKIEPETLPERKLPWLIDILLYPLNITGLSMMGIFLGVPLVMEVFVNALFSIAVRFPPFVVFAYFFLIISMIINLVVRFYKFWYISECIRDSAHGQIRVSETVATTPGVWELFLLFLRMYVCIIVLIAPVYYYLLHSMGIERSFGARLSFTLFFLWIVVSEVGKSGITFHLLLFFAVFFFPITILSVVMFGSLRGLNPVLIVRSLFCTFAPYCGLILLLCVLWLPVILMRKFIVTQVVSGQPGFFLYLPRALGIYLMLVGAHLLGRFYWRYQEKLNWEV